jgi:hypothetical protein
MLHITKDYAQIREVSFFGKHIFPVLQNFTRDDQLTMHVKREYVIGTGGYF